MLILNIGYKKYKSQKNLKNTRYISRQLKN